MKKRLTAEAKRELSLSSSRLFFIVVYSLPDFNDLGSKFANKTNLKKEGGIKCNKNMRVHSAFF